MIKSSLGATDVAIDRVIDSDFDVIKEVGDNLTAILAVENNLTTIGLVNTNEININSVAGAVESGAVDTVADNVVDVTAISTALGDGTFANVDLVVVDPLKSNINTVADISSEVVVVAGDTLVVQGLYAIIATLNSIFADKTILDSIYVDKATLDSIFADKATLDSLFADKTKLDAIFAELAAVVVAADNLVDITNFVDVYYGPKAVDPTLRNDGATMVEGDMYFNTTADKINVYTGTAWEQLPTLSDAEVKTAYENNANTNEFSDAEKSSLATMEDNAKDDQIASEVISLAVGNIVATDVQAAIQELDTDKLDKTGGIITSSLEVQGDFTVSGTTVTVDSTTVTTADNLIVINSGEVGTGVTAGEAGIQIDRGLATDYEFKFDEADDSFKIGEIGSLQKVATREGAPIDQNVTFWDAAGSQISTNGSKSLSELNKVDTTAITSVTFNSDGSMTIVIP